MIEYRIDFDGDWGLWDHVVYKFVQENEYFVVEEIPGWLRATEPLVHDVKLYREIYEMEKTTPAYAVLSFNTEEDYLAFLLKWA